MGFGDEIIGSGLARGAHARGKRIALGDRRRILWSVQAHEIFKGNPNVAPPGSEHANDIEWIAHYGGNRIYGKFDFARGRWIWNDLKLVPGEFYFQPGELDFDSDIGDVIVEPRVKRDKVNKQWPVERYQQVADELIGLGISCTQLVPTGQKPLLRGVQHVMTNNFRRGAAALSKAKLLIGAEGGLHHAAAALGIKAVVIFGGFIGPNTTGYDWHHNIFVGPACGYGKACPHCQKVLQSITVEQVLLAALGQLKEGNDVRLSCPAE